MMKRTYTKYVLSPLAEAVINALFPGFMLGCLHLILTYSGFYLNSGWWWIDVPLHLTGGACVAFAAGSLIAYAVKIKKFPPGLGVLRVLGRRFLSGYPSPSGQCGYDEGSGQRPERRVDPGLDFQTAF
jgi:hypothetical protein